VTPGLPLALIPGLPLGAHSCNAFALTPGHPLGLTPGLPLGLTPRLPFGPHPYNSLCLGREPKARVATICAFKHSHLVEPGVEGQKVASHIRTYFSRK